MASDHLAGQGANTRGDDWHRNYDGSTRQQTWDYLTDNTFWTSFPARIPSADSTEYPECADRATGAGTCLTGALWFHANTDIGATNPFVDQTVVGYHGVGLANNYLAIRPDSAFVTHLYWGLSGSLKPLELWRTLSDPWLDGLSRFGVLAYQPGVGPLALRRDGSAVQIAAGLSEGMQGRLTDSTVQWASVIEPRASAGRIDASIAAVALSGTRVVDIARVVGGVLTARGSSGRVQVNAAAVATIPSDDQTCLDGAQGGAQPASRTAPITFLSRAAGGVFLLGGRDGADQPLHDIWYAPVCAPWGELHIPGYAPEHVLAATYSFRDQRLWIVDEGPSVTPSRPGVRKIRIARVEIASHSAEILGTWLVADEAETHFFALDNDGAPLLAASSPRRQRTVMARLDVNPLGVLSVTNVAHIPGALWTAPVVDEAGYSWLVVDRGGVIRAIQRSSLPLHGGDDDDRSCGFWER